MGDEKPMAMHSHTRSNKRSTAELLSRAARINNYIPESEQTNLQGFIRHPTGYPLECRRIWFKKQRKDDIFTEQDQGNIGLCFISEKYIKPGTTLEISINLRGEIHKFMGKVVLVKNLDNQYEIGLWISNKADSAKIRIVEQICHIETYLQHKRYREGPFISRERATEEWISRFAATFPSL